MRFKEEGANSTLSSKPKESVHQFQIPGSNISFTESDFNVKIGKTWTAIERLSISLKSDLTNIIKWDYFQAVSMLVL